MWESTKELAQRVARHWVLSIGGTAMAILGFAGDATGKTIPQAVWLSAALVLFGWAILRAFHDVRIARDAASQSLTARVNYREIANELTQKHHYGVHTLLHTAPKRAKTQNEKADVYQRQRLWLEAVNKWNHEVKASMIELGCSEQEVALFWTITRLTGPMMMYGDEWECAVRLHDNRLERLWSIIEDYAKRADAPHANTR